MKSSRVYFRETLWAILIVALAGLLFRFAVVGSYKVTNSALAPTLIPGDFVWSFKFPSWMSLKNRVVLIHFPKPDSPLVARRVWGVEGDRVIVSPGQVLVNDQIVGKNPRVLSRSGKRIVLKIAIWWCLPVRFLLGWKALRRKTPSTGVPFRRPKSMELLL